jgi:benzoyl-CoA reductase/2-hydroxyglutaryl-CoA dehydratase subunit BcrC/BadD/HgdB
VKTILYASPFVPAEWIEAHGLRPCRGGKKSGQPFSGLRGICPFARAFVEEAAGAEDIAGVVVTTTCDQMRHAVGLVERRSDRPLFLMNVPATWQTTAARKLYRDEVERLGRFLVNLGGESPSREKLAAVMIRHDDTRKTLRNATQRVPCSTAVPLALVGGPILDDDRSLFDIIHQAGGCVVLDATEGGLRGLPAPLDRARLGHDPLDALVEAYFGGIPDAFRRPNDGLYTWLSRELAAREVRGILFWRYVWCDVWHAELHRLRQWSPVPVAEIGDGEAVSPARLSGRVEAFVETLR